MTDTIGIAFWGGQHGKAKRMREQVQKHTLRGVLMALQTLPREWQNLEFNGFDIKTFRNAIVVCHPNLPAMAFDAGKWTKLAGEKP